MFFIIALLGVSGYFAGLRKSLIIREKNTLHSTPIYHGVLLAVNSSLASILTLVVWLIIEKNIFYELKFFFRSVITSNNSFSVFSSKFPELKISSIISGF